MWHMEVSRLVVELELQLPAYGHSSQQRQIINPLNGARN